MKDLLPEIEAWTREGQHFALATVVEGPRAGRWLAARSEGLAEGTLGKLTEPVRAAALGVLGECKSVRTRVGEVAVFLDVLRPAPTLVIVGGVHIAIALTRIAQALGYCTIVVDPRPAFGNEARFPHADRVLSEWRDEALGRIGLTRETAVAVLTHDPKLDDPRSEEHTSE